MLSFQIEKQDGTFFTGPLLFNYNVKGIPSLPVELYIRNTGDENYVGNLYVAPGEGPSYSEDLKVSEMLAGKKIWVSSILMEIPSGERVGFFLRVNPLVTPDGTNGIANLQLSRS